MRTFEAKYPGQCGECFEPIRIGDEVYYDEDDALSHATCPLENGQRAGYLAPKTSTDDMGY